jgi:hypothetical protein
LQLRPNQREDQIFAVLQDLERRYSKSNWESWLAHAGDSQKLALLMQSFAHAIVCRPVARASLVQGTTTTWADFENDGFVMLSGAHANHLIKTTALEFFCIRQCRISPHMLEECCLVPTAC